jgi:hypothetical protein
MNEKSKKYIQELSTKLLIKSSLKLEKISSKPHFLNTLTKIFITAQNYF